MRCKLCGCELTDHHQDEEHYDIGTGGLDHEVVEKYNNSTSDIINTIEFLLICLDCKHQTPYGYLWFAISDGREHVLTTKHKHVTITEIRWQNNKALKRLRIEINSTIA
jgi:hypothetical protein